MSYSRGLGLAGATAATLPVTGADTALMVMAGVAVLVVGALLFRAGRLRKVPAEQ